MTIIEVAIGWTHAHEAAEQPIVYKVLAIVKLSLTSIGLFVKPTKANLAIENNSTFLVVVVKTHKQTINTTITRNKIKVKNTIRSS